MILLNNNFIKKLKILKQTQTETLLYLTWRYKANSYIS